MTRKGAAGKWALRDKRNGEISLLDPMNPLIFLTKDELASGDYIPEHVELIKVEMISRCTCPEWKLKEGEKARCPWCRKQSRRRKP